MKKIVKALLISAVVMSPVHAFAMEPERPGQENFLTRSIYSEDRLWLLSDAGQLFSLSEKEDSVRHEDVGDTVHDMCLVEGHPTILLHTGNKWTIKRHESGAWADQSSIAAKGKSVNLVCSNHEIGLLTEKELINVDGTNTGHMKLHGKLRPGLVTALMRQDVIYVGYDAGEWGGGLQRVDRHTGSVSTIEEVNKDLEPVNGLAVVPWKPECIAVAIGLVHMYVSGRVVMICPGNNTVLGSMTKRFGQRSPNKEIPEDQAYQTMAFLGVATVGDHLTAVGLDGLYTLGADEKVKFETSAKFKTVGPFHVNFERPDMVIVMTNINQRFSVSGAVPMLVPR